MVVGEREQYVGQSGVREDVRIKEGDNHATVPDSAEACQIGLVVDIVQTAFVGRFAHVLEGLAPA